MSNHQPAGPNNVNKTKKLIHAKSNPSNPYFQPINSPKNNAPQHPKAPVEEGLNKFKKRLEEERAQRVRSISKLKLGVNPNLRSGSPCREDADTAHLKEKIRTLERK